VYTRCTLVDAGGTMTVVVVGDAAGTVSRR
jgi:hypothetical protein